MSQKLKLRTARRYDEDGQRRGAGWPRADERVYTSERLPPLHVVGPVLAAPTPLTAALLAAALLPGLLWVIHKQTDKWLPPRVGQQSHQQPMRGLQDPRPQPYPAPH